MTKKGSVHVEDVVHRIGGFRVEGDPHDPQALIGVAIDPHENQTFDLIVSVYDLRGVYNPETERWDFKPDGRLLINETLSGLTEPQLQGILQEIGPLEFVDVYAPEAPSSVPDLSLRGGSAAATRALTTQEDPPPTGPDETERANTRSSSAPPVTAAADQKDRSNLARDGDAPYDPVMLRILAAEEVRKNLWSTNKTVDVYNALTANGVPMAYQDPRIQAYWRAFTDPERKFAQLKVMSGVSILAGLTLGLGAAAAPSVAAGAINAAGNLRLAASMGSPGGAAFSLMGSYPRLSMFTMDMLAGLAEMPSVSGAVAKNTGKLPSVTLKMTKFTVGSSSQKALFNTAANTASEVVLAAVSKYCFPADTLVSAAKGTRPIQDVSVGDEVWSYDELLCRRQLNRVARIYRSEIGELITIALADDEIEATPGHPFWVDRRGWTRAEDLASGDMLRALGGRALRVEGTSLYAGPATVFNLEVEGAHTYYASTSAVLVHNTNCASRAAIVVRQTVGMPATELMYTGAAEGLVVTYNQYLKMRPGLGSAWKSFQGHHLVENHLFAYAKDDHMRPLGNYVPTLVATTREHLSTIHAPLNALLKAEGLYGRSLSNKELLKAINISHDFYKANGLGNIAASIKQFKDQVFMPMYRKNPNG